MTKLNEDRLLYAVVALASVIVIYRAEHNALPTYTGARNAGLNGWHSFLVAVSSTYLGYTPNFPSDGAVSDSTAMAAFTGVPQ